VSIQQVLPLFSANFHVQYIFNGVVRLHSHRQEYEYEFPFMDHRSVHGHLYKHTTKRVSAILNKTESMKCFAIKTTIFHYKVTIFTHRRSLTINNFTMMSVLMSNVCHSF